MLIRLVMLPSFVVGRTRPVPARCGPGGRRRVPRKTRDDLVDLGVQVGLGVVVGMRTGECARKYQVQDREDAPAGVPGLVLRSSLVQPTVPRGLDEPTRDRLLEAGDEIESLGTVFLACGAEQQLTLVVHRVLDVAVGGLENRSDDGLHRVHRVAPRS
ncbi:hypothetical protein ACFQZK_14135 [Rhodococcus aetherivorans]